MHDRLCLSSCGMVVVVVVAVVVCVRCRLSHRASGISGFSVILLEENVGLNASPDSVTFSTLSEVAKRGEI